MSKVKSQNEKILKHLQKGKKITPLIALNKFGCFRLSARIWDLRHEQGHEIIASRVTKGESTFAEYTLAEFVTEEKKVA